MSEIAETLLQAGFNVIIDASFLQRSRRKNVMAVSEASRSAMLFIETVAQKDILVNRVKRREEARVDASEAGTEVLEYQQSQIEPLNEQEKSIALQVRTDDSTDLDRLIKRIRALQSNTEQDPQNTV